MKTFPQSASTAYFYDGVTYRSTDTLDYGKGYWLKLNPSDTFGIIGTKLIPSDTLSVHAGWNMIGSISAPVPVARIMSSPPSMVASSIYGYEGIYVRSDTIKPGKAYWAKLSEDGLLVLADDSAFGKAAATRSGSLGLITGRSFRKIDIVATNDLPPPPPGEERVPSPSSEIPTEFSLEQNFPNPFNPVTTIRYDLAAPSQVMLRIYNTLGQEIRTLVNEFQEAGRRSVTFDASALSSGLYFYRLNAGRFTNTKKLLLIK
jgi:hypothetical protein